jgi:hypothetical protein
MSFGSEFRDRVRSTKVNGLNGEKSAIWGHFGASFGGCRRLSFALQAKHEAPKPAHEPQSDGGQLCWMPFAVNGNNAGGSVAIVTPERGDRGCPRPVLSYCMEVAV